jgi:glycosyltransferase involved in cell wall biosynthesis
VTATPEMSIVIGTLNRSDMLERSIETLLRQTVAADRLEIIVVDNGSTDNTREIVHRLMLKSPTLRYVEEPQKGLSNARNRGIQEARAPLVAFADDDAEAEPDWAEIILRVFESDSDVGAAGGKIFVRWPNDANVKPEWMPSSLEGYYGRCDYGNTRRVLSYPEYPFGANMVIRRDLLLKIGGFNAQLGPTGQNMMAGGETDMFFRLYQLKPKVVYEPTAIVHHWAPPDRVNRAWVKRRAFRHGIASAIMTYSNNSDRRRTRSALQFMRASTQLGIALVSTAIGALGRVSPSVVMSRRAMASYWAGMVRGSASNLLKVR